ncbi:hypothetical protein [Aliiruegeria sabulilitoris]|uniref:hypothetical protein n=1 Tax=Aliiruegeria sabulilitoris TaxID=1510458 RepID=UPI00082D20CB|nr:hypothetical protein [Aliiruegeria sabulilitoris]NDR59106.1 hypothetical protein [Pseudoruegeria sp. M32A2M]
MKIAGALAFVGLTTLPALAGGIVEAPYDALARELTERVDFERLPRREEPGFNLDMPLYASGAWLGERFEGQSVETDPKGHDRIAADDVAGWLRIAGGAPRRNLNVAFHRGFGSNAVFPLGAAGFPEISARGEGSLAILFDHDQKATGFRVHTDYTDPLGSRPTSDSGIEVLFYSREGRLLDRLQHRPGPGISAFGYTQSTGAPGIAGLVILNTDPGGIAVDDIIFALPPLLG